MATQVQQRRGTTAEHATFTGAVGEVTVDTDKDTAVVHDGTTAGGRPLMLESGSNSALALGSAGTPSLKFTGDPNTGIYSPGADQVAISTNGTGRLFINDAGRVGLGTNSPAENLVISNNGGSGLEFNPSGVDSGPFLQAFNRTTSSAVPLTTVSSYFAFRTGSSPSETMRLDSSGRLGLGTSSPGGNLDVAATNPIVRITSTFNGNPTPGNSLAEINFYGSDGSSSGPGNNCFIRAIYEDAFGADVGLVFGTTTSNGDGTEKLRITHDGRVGIGTASPAYPLEVFKDSGLIGLIPNAANGNTIRYGGISGTANQLIFTGAGDAERARIDSSGRLLVGTSSARETTSGNDALAQFERAGGSGLLASATRNSNDAFGPRLAFIKSRGTAVGSNTVVQSGDALGGIVFHGADGTNPEIAALIQAEVDGTPGADDMPGRLVFSTTADGASSPTERARIINSGAFKATNTGSYRGAGENVHELRSNNDNANAAVISHVGTNGTQFGLVVETANDQNDTTRYFFECRGGATVRATIRSNGGLANYSASNVNLSDINTKKDISPATETWDCLKEWEIVNFRYKDQSENEDLNLGVIAQQVAESCPEVITVFQEAKEATEDQPAQEERLGVKEQQMMWMAIKALQEAQLRIETLEAEVAALKAS